MVRTVPGASRVETTSRGAARPQNNQRLEEWPLGLDEANPLKRAKVALEAGDFGRCPVILA